MRIMGTYFRVFLAGIVFMLTFSLIQLLPEVVPQAKSQAAGPLPHYVTLSLMNGNAISGRLLARSPRTGTCVIGWKGGAVSFSSVEIRRIKFHTDDFTPPGDGIYIRSIGTDEEYPSTARAWHVRPNLFKIQASLMSRKLSSLGQKFREWRDVWSTYRSILHEHGF